MLKTLFPVALFPEYWPTDDTSAVLLLNKWGTDKLLHKVSKHKVISLPALLWIQPKYVNLLFLIAFCLFPQLVLLVKPIGSLAQIFGCFLCFNPFTTSLILQPASGIVTRATMALVIRRAQFSMGLLFWPLCDKSEPACEEGIASVTGGLGTPQHSCLSTRLWLLYQGLSLLHFGLLHLKLSEFLSQLCSWQIHLVS